MLLKSVPVKCSFSNSMPPSAENLLDRAGWLGRPPTPRRDCHLDSPHRTHLHDHPRRQPVLPDSGKTNGRADHSGIGSGPRPGRPKSRGDDAAAQANSRTGAPNSYRNRATLQRTAPQTPKLHVRGVTKTTEMPGRRRAAAVLTGVTPRILQGEPVSMIGLRADGTVGQR